MIAPDTSVLVRIITRDYEAQADRAAEVLRSERLWLAKTVILEVEWVLRFTYKYDRASVNRALTTLVGQENALIEDAVAVELAVAWHADGMDFADALHLASNRQASEFVTFDRKLASAAGRIPGTPTVRLLRGEDG